MQVEEFLEQSSRRSPGKTALICQQRRLSYKQVEEQSNQLAHALIEHGVERGDRVAIYLENSVEAVLSIFAVLKAGAVFLVVNPTTKVDKLAYILNNCRAVALITDIRNLAGLESRMPQLPHLKSIFAAGMGSTSLRDSEAQLVSFENTLCRADLPNLPPVKKCIDIDLAALVYTSGSTGKPKGVMLTHLNIFSAATSITTYLENVPDDVILNV